MCGTRAWMQSARYAARALDVTVPQLVLLSEFLVRRAEHPVAVLRAPYAGLMATPSCGEVPAF